MFPISVLRKEDHCFGIIVHTLALLLAAKRTKFFEATSRNFVLLLSCDHPKWYVSAGT